MRHNAGVPKGELRAEPGEGVNGGPAAGCAARLSGQRKPKVNPRRAPWRRGSTCESREPVLQTLRTYWTTAVLGLLILYFGIHALTGDRGILSTGERDQALLERQAELAALTQRRTELETRARLLRDESISADLLDERARALLGFADPRDYVIRVGP